MPMMGGELCNEQNTTMNERRKKTKDKNTTVEHQATREEALAS